METLAFGPDMPVSGKVLKLLVGSFDLSTRDLKRTQHKLKTFMVTARQTGTSYSRHGMQPLKDLRV